MKKKTLALLLCAVLLLSILPMTGAAADAVSYLDADGTTKTQDNVTVLTSTEVTDGALPELTEGWYLVKGSIAVSKTVNVSGNVNLILEDGAELTVQGALDAIKINDEASLTIYGQEGQNGSLVANGAFGSASGAGIIGTVTINGGEVNASGGDRTTWDSAGDAFKGTVTINGGKVNASGGDNTGSGGGGNAFNGTVTINGGAVSAAGGVPEEGGRGSAFKGELNLNGGTVEATASYITFKFNCDVNLGEGVTIDGIDTSLELDAIKAALSAIEGPFTVVPNSATEEEAAPIVITNGTPGTALDSTNDNDTQDVEVAYTYAEPDNTTAKYFYVTLEYTLPDTLNVAASEGSSNEYVWDPAAGKYTLATPVTMNYDLGGGAFSVKVTNQSNVSIDYEVAYAPNTDSIFVNALSGDMTNASGTLDTVVADATQTVNEDGSITINDTAAAVVGNTTFATATCAGALAISGIKEGATPATSGTETLGTFTVTITETEPEPIVEEPIIEEPIIEETISEEPEAGT